MCRRVSSLPTLQSREYRLRHRAAKIDRERVRNAAQQAALADFIDSLRRTMKRESVSAASLSGGNATNRHAGRSTAGTVLVFDEATSRSTWRPSKSHGRDSGTARRPDGADQSRIASRRSNIATNCNDRERPAEVGKSRGQIA